MSIALPDRWCELLLVEEWATLPEPIREKLAATLEGIAEDVRCLAYEDPVKGAGEVQSELLELARIAANAWVHPNWNAPPPKAEPWIEDLLR